MLDNIDPSAICSRGVFGRRHVQQDPATIAPFLCNDLDEKGAGFVLNCIVDDAAGLLLEPVDLAGLGDVPRTYVCLARDQTYPPELPANAVAAISPTDEMQLDSGHMVMVSQPHALAKFLNQLT